MAEQRTLERSVTDVASIAGSRGYSAQVGCRVDRRYVGILTSVAVAAGTGHNSVVIIRYPKE